MPSFWERVSAAAGAFKNGSIRTSLDYWKQVYGGRESKSGATITWRRAVEVAAVMACTRVLANGIAQVPLKLMREGKDGTRQPADDHPLYLLLHRRPNPWQTSYEFREQMMLHAVLTGDAFAFLNRVGSAREIREIILIDPGRVTVQRETTTGALSYKVSSEDGAGAKVFPGEAIWHIRGPSWTGWKGMGAVQTARESIGLGIALEEDQAAFHRDGSRTTGLLSIENAVGVEKYKELAAWVDQHSAGGERYQKPMILDQGAKFTPTRMSGVEAQHLESRKLQIEEICRAIGVMPLMIGHPADMAARAATESIFLAHVTHTLMPWYTRIEQSAEVNLLTEKDLRKGLYVKFFAQALMRGASKERAEYYKAALGSGSSKGWLTQNEVRALEDQDRSEDPEANKLPQPTAQPAAGADGLDSGDATDQPADTGDPGEDT